MSKSYEIRTLKDIYDNVPTDRVDICFQEIHSAIRSAMLTRDLIKDMMAAEGEAVEDINSIMVYPEVTTWVDDDKGEVGFTLNSAENQESLLSVNVKKEGAE